MPMLKCARRMYVCSTINFTMADPYVEIKGHAHAAHIEHVQNDFSALQNCNFNLALLVHGGDVASEKSATFSHSK